jgi:hypothetical protein
MRMRTNSALIQPGVSNGLVILFKEFRCTYFQAQVTVLNTLDNESNEITINRTQIEFYFKFDSGTLTM